MACSRPCSTEGAWHGETSTSGHGIGGSSPGADPGGEDAGRTALRAGCSVAGAARRFAGANGGGIGCWACHGGQVPSAHAQASGRVRGVGAEVGWSATRLDERRGGAQLPRAVGETLRGGRPAGGVAAARSTLAEAGAPCSGLGRIPHARAPWLAQGGARHPTSQERPPRAGGLEKNCPKRWQPCSGPKKSAAAGCA